MGKIDRDPNSIHPLLVPFNKACIELKDPTDLEQCGSFATAVTRMQKAGFSVTNILSLLRSVRPDFNLKDETRIDECVRVDKFIRDMVITVKESHLPENEVLLELKRQTSFNTFISLWNQAPRPL